MEVFGVTGDPAVHGRLSLEKLNALEASQDEAAQAVINYWQESKPGDPWPLLLKPTGYGKSRVIDRVIDWQFKKYHSEKAMNALAEGKKILFIVGTKDVLVDQNQEALRSLVHEQTGEERFSILPDTSGPVILCTWQSLDAFEKRYVSTPSIGLAIVDEVHNAGTARRRAILRRLKPDAVVGLTATAYRSSGKYRDPEDYGFHVLDNVISTLPGCIDEEWLSPLMGICIDTGVVLPVDVLNKGEINLKKVYRQLRHHPDLFKNIATEIGTRFLPKGMKTLVVVNRVQGEACVIARQLQKMGFKVGLAVNERAADQLEGEFVTHGAIERYKLPSSHPDAIQVLISPQVIGEGFDAPATECIIWAAPTASGLRYTQVMGRGARRCFGKQYCLIVDFVFLIEEYGYSMNFAQFFKKNEVKELQHGVLYVGPNWSNDLPAVPDLYTRDARLVGIAKLNKVSLKPKGDWLPVSAISERLFGVKHRQRWVLSRLKQLGIGGELRNGNSGANIHYPPDCLEPLAALAEKEPPIEEYRSSVMASKELFGTPSRLKWVEAAAARMGVVPREMTVQGKPAAMYPKSLIRILAPLAEEERRRETYISSAKLSERLFGNKNHAWWIERSLREIGIEPISVEIKDKVLKVFPPESEASLVPIVKKWKEDNQKLTASQLAGRILGSEARDKVITTALRELGYEGTAIGGTKSIRVGFPPQAEEPLRAHLRSKGILK